MSDVRDVPSLTPEQQQLVLGVLDLIEARVTFLAPHAPSHLREELVSYGQYGAMVAAARFDRALETRFMSYAFPYITGEILDGLSRDRQSRRLARAASWAARTFVSETSDRFDVAWDSEATNQTKLYRYAHQLITTMVLEVARQGDHADDRAADADDRRRALEILRPLIAEMSDDERRLYTLRYVEGLPMSTVAKELGVSYATVRRHHEQLLDRIAAALAGSGITAVSFD